MAVVAPFLTMPNGILLEFAKCELSSLAKQVDNFGQLPFRYSLCKINSFIRSKNVLFKCRNHNYGKLIIYSYTCFTCLKKVLFCTNKYVLLGIQCLLLSKNRKNVFCAGKSIDPQGSVHTLPYKYI